MSYGRTPQVPVEGIRVTLVTLLPEAKQAEFYARTGTGPATGEYTSTMLREAAAFFGVQPQPAPARTKTAAPTPWGFSRSARA